MKLIEKDDNYVFASVLDDSPNRIAMINFYKCSVKSLLISMNEYEISGTQEDITAFIKRGPVQSRRGY